ncbi:MAG: hypothetical protein HZB19_22280 [Chloroflexi bacterium]|nr:hypothetical protein [Chloroflexota bacterium]
MFRAKTLLALLIALSVLVSACAPAVNAEAGSGSQNAAPSSSVGNEAVSSADGNQVSGESNPSGESSSELDLHNIPAGDGKVSTQPQVGYIYSCQTSFNGGGAFASGDWGCTPTGRMTLLQSLWWTAR